MKLLQLGFSSKFKKKVKCEKKIKTMYVELRETGTEFYIFRFCVRIVVIEERCINYILPSNKLPPN